MASFRHRAAYWEWVMWLPETLAEIAKVWAGVRNLSQESSLARR